jgi:hypothetical protein
MKRHFGYFDICTLIFLKPSFPSKEKTETNSSVECSKSKECVSLSTRFGHLNFEFWYCFGFRISVFAFRIFLHDNALSHVPHPLSPADPFMGKDPLPKRGNTSLFKKGRWEGFCNGTIDRISDLF